MELTWVETSEKALIHNLKTFRGIVGQNVTLAPVVKANAYGHGLIFCARAFEGAGADYLCVNAVYEAEALRKAGIQIPLLVLGYTPLSALLEAVKLKCDLTVYNLETIRALEKLNEKVSLHLKIETGTHRQGVYTKDLPKVIREFKKYPKLQLMGASTHFANLEDRVNQHYAKYQLSEFNRAVDTLASEGFTPKHLHTASSVATMLLPDSRFNFVRPGISCYGLWPSKKTKISTKRAGIKLDLKPALSWKTVVAQVKEVRRGALVGYGCSYEMPHNGRIAVLPIGYYDGYVRALGGRAHVLIRGKIAPVIGRICMNICMADVTKIPGVELEDEVVLIGGQGKNRVTAEQIAEWSHTINYEVTTRINKQIPRVLIK